MICNDKVSYCNISVSWFDLWLEEDGGRFENGFSQFLLCERAGLTENVKEGCEKTDLDKVVADCSRIFQSVRMR